MAEDFRIPDTEVDHFIRSLGAEFDIELISLTSEKKKSEISGSTYEDWAYTFRKSGSPTSMKITSTFPEGFIGISFKSDIKKAQHSPDYFFFEEYLSQIRKAQSDINKINEVAHNKTWKKDWKIPLEILRDHLRADLINVINGKEWPTVYFDWADYVEPEALDKIYEDQLTHIEKKSKTKRGWLYFLNFGKNKGK